MRGKSAYPHQTLGTCQSTKHLGLTHHCSVAWPQPDLQTVRSSHALWGWCTGDSSLTHWPSSEGNGTQACCSWPHGCNRETGPAASPAVSRGLWRLGVSILQFAVGQEDLPAGPGGPLGPWVPMPGFPFSPFTPVKPSCCCCLKKKKEKKILLKWNLGSSAFPGFHKDLSDEDSEGWFGVRSPRDFLNWIWHWGLLHSHIQKTGSVSECVVCVCDNASLQSSLRWGGPAHWDLAGVLHTQAIGLMQLALRKEHNRNNQWTCLTFSFGSTL